MAKTTIPWAHYTFNPWIGCSAVSPGCKFCYAEAFAGRYLKVQWGNKPRHITADSTWAKPLAWQKAAVKANTRYRVFCASLSDVFENNIQLIEPRQRLWQLVEKTPDLNWLLLTKRPENYAQLFPVEWLQGSFPQNIWLGTSICTQKEYDVNWPILKEFQKRHAVKVSFVSFEPLLELIKLHNGAPDCSIIGGESGFLKNAREMKLEWVKSMFEDIRAMNDDTRCIFFKQLGSQIAHKLKLRDGKGETFEQYPPYLDWLKLREVPFENKNILEPKIQSELF